MRLIKTAIRAMHGNFLIRKPALQTKPNYICDGSIGASGPKPALSADVAKVFNEFSGLKRLINPLPWNDRR